MGCLVMEIFVEPGKSGNALATGLLDDTHESMQETFDLVQKKGVVLTTTIDKYCYISYRYSPPFLYYLAAPRFNATFAHKPDLVERYLHDVYAVSQVLAEAISRDDIGSRLCGPAKHADFRRLT